MEQPRPLRVLRVLPTLGAGGAERQCAEVLAEFQRNRAVLNTHVDVATLYGPADAHTVALSAGITWHQLDCRAGIAGPISAAKRLAKLTQHYDVIHGLLWPAVWALALAKPKPPWLASIHGSAVRSGPAGIKGLADRYFFRKATALVFNSEPGRQKLATYYGWQPSAARVIPNGKQLYGGPWPEREGLCCIARVATPKRHDLLLASLARIPAEHPRVRLAGAKTDGEAIAAELRSHNLSTVETLGVINDPLSLLASSQIAALPTDHEGMPNAILEAWNAGAAVLASRVSGVRELVHDGEDGLLVDNTPAAWAIAIQQLMSDAQLRERLAANGRERLKNEFSLETTTKAWAELYAGLAN